VAPVEVQHHLEKDEVDAYSHGDDQKKGQLFLMAR
jgi:hypothetical protein